MAHPKKRTSKATKGQRNSHSALKTEQLFGVDSSTRKVAHRFINAAKIKIDRIRNK